VGRWCDGAQSTRPVYSVFLLLFMRASLVELCNFTAVDPREDAEPGTREVRSESAAWSASGGRAGAWRSTEVRGGVQIAAAYLVGCRHMRVAAAMDRVYSVSRVVGPPLGVTPLGSVRPHRGRVGPSGSLFSPREKSDRGFVF
jgi:hypothetical protein